jgi:hypothetical protein
MPSPNSADPFAPASPASEPLIEEARRLLRESPEGLQRSLSDVLDRLEWRLDEAFVAGLKPRR